MFNNTLAEPTKKLFSLLKTAEWLKKFYLAGGTALALHYGHRRSVDLDWFTVGHINIPALLKNVASVGRFELINREKDTLEGVLEGVKVSLMTYPYGLLQSPILIEGVKIAAPLDIAVMKLGAIADRNTKKDFIDLFTFLIREEMSLADLLEKARKKFAGVSYDPYHLYKALTYFVDADKDAMPKLFVKLDWNEIKRFFTREVRKLAGK